MRLSLVSNRHRSMKLLEILKEKTDEEHGLTILELTQELETELGPDYKIHRNSLLSDLDFLNTNVGLIVNRNGPHNSNEYAIERTFETHELRVLIDAVASARFITQEQTAKLIEKIKSLTSQRMRRRLHNQIYLNGVKTRVTKVPIYIDKIHSAITEHRRITFQYQKYNVDRKLELHRGGKRYTAQPYGLVWNADFYYLIAKEDSANAFKTFRVDRMVEVQVTGEHFSAEQFNVAEYVEKSFNMYPGPVEPVVIEFHKHLINVVTDRFGENVHSERTSDDFFKIRIHAAISDGLVRWILTWGSDARVLAPQILVDRLRGESEKMYRLYH